MVKYERISIEEARAEKRTLKKKPIILEYQNMLRELKQGDAFKIDASVEGEKGLTVKNRLIRVAKEMGIVGLVVQRRGDKISFWLKPEKKSTERKRKTATTQSK